MSRRSFLRHGVEGLALPTVLGACGTGASPNSPQTSSAPEASPTRGTRNAILLAYFSRPGENYWNGGRKNLRVGNTEVLAQMIHERVDCDIHRIIAADPYPTDYEETVQRNVREQDSDARPATASRLRSIARYDTVLLASPIWNVRAPMIMSTFTERYDFTGKTVLPITTYAMSGLGTTEDDYAQSCRGARIGTGLAVRGERVRSAERAVEDWLRRVRLTGG